MANVEIEELKKLIRDSVGSEIARQAQDSLDKAKEDADKARAAGVNPLSELQRQVAGSHFQRADVAANGTVRNDPHQGRGLDFARAIKAGVVGQLSHRSAQDVAHAWSKDGAAHYGRVAELLDGTKRAMGESPVSSGGALVPGSATVEFIELLYPASLAMSLGARDMEINRTQDFGRLNQGATVAYVGELSNVVPSTPATGQLRATSHKAAAIVPLSNELLRNPSVGADMILRDDLLAAMGARRDLSFYRGAGSSNQPKGVKSWMKAGNKANQSGTAISNKVADLMKLIRYVDESNVPMGGAAFVMAPRTKWALAATLDGNSQFVFASMLAAGTLFGFRAASSTQIPTNLGGGSDSEIYFGAHSDGIITRDVSQPMAIETFLNGTYHDGSALVSGISTDQSVVRIIEGHDVILRHDNTFSMLEQVTWS